jgi:hypothetical protein
VISEIIIAETMKITVLWDIKMDSVRPSEKLATMYQITQFDVQERDIFK